MRGNIVPEGQDSVRNHMQLAENVHAVVGLAVRQPGWRKSVEQESFIGMVGSLAGIEHNDVIEFDLFWKGRSGKKSSSPSLSDSSALSGVPKFLDPLGRMS